MDVATEPGHVRRAVRDRELHADRYVFISSCIAHASLAATGVYEEAPRRTPLSTDEMASPEQYGPAKVAGEDAVRAAFGPGRSVVIRPSLIGGPRDATGRTAYWQLRFRRLSNPQGRVLVPVVPTQDTAVIDVHDLAAWVVHLIERARSGVCRAPSETIPFATISSQHAEKLVMTDRWFVRARSGSPPAVRRNGWGHVLCPCGSMNPRLQGLGRCPTYELSPPA